MCLDNCVQRDKIDVIPCWNKMHAQTVWEGLGQQSPQGSSLSNVKGSCS